MAALTDVGYPLARVRSDFPLLDQIVRGHRLVYLDSAASSQRPLRVLDAMRDYEVTTHANVHRGVYGMAEEATRLYEEARAKVGRFIGAPSPSREVVFTKNTTEALNLIVATWGRRNLSAGDAVVLTEMEHHANIVPWLMLAEEKGIELRWLAVDDSGRLVTDDLPRLFDGAKALAITCMSNVLGTRNDLPTLSAIAHEAGAVVIADGAQSVPHLPTDVAALGADFLAFSGHKMLGPTGIGVLWGRESLLDAMPPFLGGGEMILDVRKDGFTCNELPWKFEAGTPPITEAIGLGAAVDYLVELTMEAVREHDVALTRYALDTFAERFGGDLTVYGPADPDERGGVLSFAFRDIHPHDLSQVLDQAGVCIRAGHHCAKPLMRRLGVGATARASFGVYTGEDDVDALVEALADAERLFG